MRIAGYARVSTQEQKLHGVSIHAQEDALREWGEKNGVYVGCYNDAGISARSRYTKRPALLRLIEDVKAKRVDLIIFTKLDRWFRNVGDYYEIQRILDDNGVQWRAIWEDYETQTASGRLKVNIMLSVAQDEADRTGERIRQVNAYRWANGEIPRNLPYGYKRDGKKVVKDPQKAPAIEEFFKVYLKTGSTVQAVDAAADLGLPMSLSGARKTLANPFYTGETNGIQYPAFLSREEFDLLQRRRMAYTRKAGENRIYLFAGLLRCGNCGAKMSSARGDGKNYLYTCVRYSNRTGCAPKIRGYTSEHKLEAWLLDQLDALHLETERVQRNVKRRAKKAPSRETIQNRLNRAKMLFVNGDFTLEEYTATKEKLEAELNNIAQPPEPKLAPLPNNWRDMYESLSRAGKKAFWRGIIDHIVIYHDAPPKVIFL